MVSLESGIPQDHFRIDAGRRRRQPLCSYHPFQETLRSGSDRFWMTECGHFLCDRHEHQPGICTHCKSSPISTYKITPSMDPSLMIWFRTPLGSLMTASRTIDFQQAEVSRLVSHLREQISKQNKALKKAAQQIRENSKTATELENARTEIIGLKRELGRLSTGTHGASHTTGPALQPPVVVRPIPRQHTSSDGGRQFLITGTFPESDRTGRDMAGAQTTNDGFGAGSERRGMIRTQADMPLGEQAGPSHRHSLQNQTNVDRIQNRPLTNDATGVVVSDRTKGMGSFKHPDILGLSPRKRARPDHEEE